MTTSNNLSKFEWMKAFAYNGQKMPAEAAIVIWHHINSVTLEWKVSYEDMAHASGKSADAMEAQVKKLVTAGWLAIAERGGKGKKTKYRLAVPDGFDWSRCTQDHKMDGGVHTPNKGRTHPVVGGVDTPLYRDNKSTTDINMYRELDGGVDTHCWDGWKENPAASEAVTTTDHSVEIGTTDEWPGSATATRRQEQQTQLS
ncbi:hypothetical protein GFY24_15285 [Nocardia sp. SYP-A9097]|uniref:hypothetical protein n=1 Tax=Nocardia sp. SYP-A9097 TaxID=2663237 RepID=UPI00129AFBDD|nr:hypothetical protein [Nocardia sp. SYP-A9097]MRH88791.1 hypothetical protein [Nocardia sp. SYP-A9097]